MGGQAEGLYIHPKIHSSFPCFLALGGFLGLKFIQVPSKPSAIWLLVRTGPRSIIGIYTSVFFWGPGLASFQGANLLLFFLWEYKYNRQKLWTVSLLEDFVILPFWARKPFGSTWTFLGGFGGITKIKEKVRTWQFFAPFVGMVS